MANRLTSKQRRFQPVSHLPSATCRYTSSTSPQRSSSSAPVSSSITSQSSRVTIYCKPHHSVRFPSLQRRLTVTSPPSLFPILSPHLNVQQLGDVSGKYLRTQETWRAPPAEARNLNKPQATSIALGVKARISPFPTLRKTKRSRFRCSAIGMRFKQGQLQARLVLGSSIRPAYLASN
jgi:hypothetical protein